MHKTTVIMQIPVYRQNPVTSKLETADYIVRHIKPGRKETKALADLYKRRLKESENALAVSPAQVNSWLEKDPGSVLAGFIKDQMVSMINIVKLDIEKLSDIPTSHQALTGDDSWATTAPYGNVWVCPWLTTHAELASGWKGEINGHFKDLSQLQVLAVKAAADLKKRTLGAIVTFYRPSGLMEFLENNWGRKFNHLFPGQIELSGYGSIKTDKDGLFVSGPMGIPTRLFYLRRYLSRLDSEGRVVDPDLRVHIENGAQIDPNLIFPRGHILDHKPIFYRIGLLNRTT